MARPLYDFHYYAASDSDYYLTCGRLATVICERWSRRSAAVDDAQGVRDEEGGHYSIAGLLDDVGTWEAVAALQWVIVSDHVITMRAMNDRLDALAANGLLDQVRQAFHELVAAISAKYPALARAGRPALVQLVALGRDMAIAAGDAPDFFEFVKKELQPVNLAAALLV